MQVVTTANISSVGPNTMHRGTIRTEGIYFITHVAGSGGSSAGHTESPKKGDIKYHQNSKTKFGVQGYSRLGI